MERPRPARLLIRRYGEAIVTGSASPASGPGDRPVCRRGTQRGARNPLHAYRLAGGRGSGGRGARRLASTSLGRARCYPDFGSSTSVPELGPGLTSITANQGHQMARLTFSPRRRCAWLVLSCRAGWWWWRGQPQASLRMACPFVSGGVVVVVAGSAPGVAAHGLSFRVGRGGGGGGVSPRRRCAWLVLSCRAGWWWWRGQPQASLRMACPFVSGGVVVVAGSAPGVAAHGLSFRVGRGGGGGGVSPRRRCAWLVLSCRAGWWWWRGQPQASLRMACPFVSGGVVVVAGSAPGVAAHGILPSAPTF